MNSVPYNAKLLADMLLNDLVSNDPIVITPGGLRAVSIGDSNLNIKTYNEVFEATKVLSNLLNNANAKGAVKVGKRNKVNVADSFIPYPLENLNMKMFYDILTEFFKKFDCVLRVRENHTAVDKENRIKIKVVWKSN
jgi:hypothetical protein